MTAIRDPEQRHLVAVWNPSYGTDVMESHIMLLRECARRFRQGDDGAADLLMDVQMACMAAPDLGAAVAEQAADLSEMAAKYRSRDVSSADEKYLYQRAYNARRGKAMYEEKISRRRS